MKLVIISHTEHYTNSNGTLVGWGPTISEINHLTSVFDEIVHLAMLYAGDPPPSALPYISKQIQFVPIPSVGGHGILNKLKIIRNIPRTLAVVKKYLKKCDVFQLRTPTGIGVYLIPYLIVFSKKSGWFKYAGNWNQKNAPFGYRVQRWFLKNQKRTVTINGKWPDQPDHCLTFENPCLTREDINRGNFIRGEKSYLHPLVFCFVGRLERQKGVLRIVLALNDLTENEKAKIGTIHMVGTGVEIAHFKEKAKQTGLNFIFHESLSRQDVYKIYEDSNVFLLPSSASEGFPKVIAEAINFGCIPIVSAVSSITQYIEHKKNGLIVHPISTDAVVKQLNCILNTEETILIKWVSGQEALIQKFSFDFYNERIKNDILNPFKL